MLASKSVPLVLGSASPRRRDILGGLGIPIRVLPGDIDETPRPSERAVDYLERIVKDKLDDVVRRLAAGGGKEAVAGVLVADTIVVVDESILGKPRDVAEARQLLSLIVGRTHVVRTRYAIAVAPHLDRLAVARTVESQVTMRAADPGVVARYAATGEGLDKAGAYAGQGIGAFLVERIEGSFSNVVGLPACEVVLDLERLGIVQDYPLSPGG
jgi:septum formation protein